ncbi:MAG: hypothetical protein HY675_02320 [Chloroflexi bacterium]|nr:hypothetical protein [Chloroflexota bacterium]
MRFLTFLVLITLLSLAASSTVALAAEPPWPDDPTVPHTTFDPSGPDGGPGYWQWNAYRFVTSESGSHWWAPRWEWAP